jgi:hypothetical protein
VLVHVAFAGFGRQDLKQYPYIASEDADLTPALTALLNQQATWQMLQLKGEVDDLVMRSGSGSKTLPKGAAACAADGSPDSCYEIVEVL